MTFIVFRTFDILLVHDARRTKNESRRHEFCEFEGSQGVPFKLCSQGPIPLSGLKTLERSGVSLPISLLDLLGNTSTGVASAG